MWDACTLLPPKRASLGPAVFLVLTGCACTGVGGFCGGTAIGECTGSEWITTAGCCDFAGADCSCPSVVMAGEYQGWAISIPSLRGGGRESEQRDDRVALSQRRSTTKAARIGQRAPHDPAREQHDTGIESSTTRAHDGTMQDHHLRDVGQHCISILRALGGAAELPRIVARWRQLFPRDFLARDGTHVYRGQSAVRFEEAMAATDSVEVMRDQRRSDVKLFALTDRLQHQQQTIPARPTNHGSPPGADAAASGARGHASPPPQPAKAAPLQPTPISVPRGIAQNLPKYMVLHKTRMCRDWMQTGKCQFEGHCSFAHGRHELRNPVHVLENQALPDPRVLVQQRESQSKQPATASLSQLPIPIDPTAENHTFTGRIMRVMSSENYPMEAHFCIMESSPNIADVFVSRKVLGEEVWSDLDEWWTRSKGAGTQHFSISVECQRFRKGSNNYRAIHVLGKVEVPDETPKSAPANNTLDEVQPAGSVDVEVPVVGGVMRGKPLGGDFAPKLGYRCVITSSGKNFSFADECIYIRNELRDAHGVRGLWAGDIVTVDAAYNANKGNWVATAVSLVQRNNSGFLQFQEAVDQIAQQRATQNQPQPADHADETSQAAPTPKAPEDNSGAVARQAELPARLPVTASNLSAVLEDPVMLQNLIAALQQQQQRQPQSQGESRPAGDAGAEWKSLYKTEMCANILASGRCRYGSKCTFAHSKDELRGPDGQSAVQAPSDVSGKRSERPDGDSDVERAGRKRARSELDTDRTLSVFTDAEICTGELFVGGLPKRRYSSAHLRNVFAKYGEVKDCRIIMDTSRTPPTSRGYGFVSFVDPKNNLMATKALDGQRLAGRYLRVTPAAKSREEEEAAKEKEGDDDQLDAELLADDYVDPKETLSPSKAPQEAYGEDQFVCQKSQQGPMHVSMMQGLPNYMEDNWAVLLGDGPTNSEGEKYHKDSFNMFGVFDGHNGYRGSLFAREMLLQNIKQLLPDYPSTDDVVHATHDGHLKTDAEFLAMNMGDGACTVTLVVTPSHLIAANAGDSRAVLGVNGQAVELTQDHKPGRPDEQQRIEGLGGFVLNLGVPRVMGYLAVSRALGDAALKTFVIADPETQVYERADDQRFVVLATDGLWDVMSSEAVVQFVYQHWHLPDHGAELLVKEALSLVSHDNICAMVVDVQLNRTPAEPMPDQAVTDPAEAVPAPDFNESAGTVAAPTQGRNRRLVKGEWRAPKRKEGAEPRKRKLKASSETDDAGSGHEDFRAASRGNSASAEARDQGDSNEVESADTGAVS